MEYGDDDEDDDLEEIAGDTLKANSNVQIASKPFWAVWSWKISSLLIYLVNKKSLLVHFTCKWKNVGTVSGLYQFYCSQCVRTP